MTPSLRSEDVAAVAEYIYRKLRADYNPELKAVDLSQGVLEALLLQACRYADVPVEPPPEEST